MFDVVTAVMAGMMMPFQAAINAQLGKAVGSPVLAAFVSFFVGTLCLLVWVFSQNVNWPQSSLWFNLPPRLLVGGVIGALFVALITILIPRLGAATMVALILGGQVFSSLLLDHFGLLDIPQRNFTLARGIGAFFLISGIYMIRRF